jgi:hypothetical protein
MLRLESQLMLRRVSCIRPHVALACHVVLPSLTGCASKRFVPRILSESVIIRDAARPADAATATAPHVTETVKPSSLSTSTTAGTSRRWQRRAVGTMGIGEREWKGSLEETFGAVEEAPAAIPQKARERQETKPAPATTKLASMGDSGWLLAILAIGCALGAFVYRYRVY